MELTMKRMLTVCISVSAVWSHVVYSVAVEEVQRLQDVFSGLQSENNRLTSECDFLKNENTKLWADVNHLSAEVRDLQQYTRVDNLEISGVPQQPNEDIYDILKKVCKSIGIIFNRDEISEAHRLPKGKQGHPFIIVRFISRKCRDKWLSAAKVRVGDVKHIYPDLPSSPFFINQHLTSFKKGLLDMAKRLVSEGVYTFAWVKDGKVYVRKTPTSDVIRVRSFEDFDQTTTSNSTLKVQ